MRKPKKTTTRPPWQQAADELCRRFRLPGHEWKFAHTVTDASLVIRRDGDAVLVRQPEQVKATLAGHPVILQKPTGPARLTEHDAGCIKAEMHRAEMHCEMVRQKTTESADPIRAFTFNPRAALNGDLLARAEAGDGLAIKEAAALAVELTKVLTKLRGNKRTIDKVRAVAADMFQWPALLGASKEMAENCEGVVESIGLGKGRVGHVGGRADWRDDDAGHIAQALLMHESKPRTWAAARKLLLESYPDPVSVPELAALPVPPSKRNGKGTHRSAILELLKKRFDSRCHT